MSNSKIGWNANEVIIKKFNQCYMHEYTTLRLQLLTGTNFSEFLKVVGLASINFSNFPKMYV